LSPQATGNRSLAAFCTFFISAIFHEYILTVVNGFYFPVLFIMFGGIGVVMYFVSMSLKSLNPSLGNYFMFELLFLGYAILLTIFPIEWFSRKNCPSAFNVIKIELDSYHTF